MRDTVTQRGLGGGAGSGGPAGPAIHYLLCAELVGLPGGVYETIRLCQIRVSRSFYNPGMPKLWNETIELHRREVREAILDTTVGLVAEQGLLSVTMSQIAEETGIGRATLYKYFSDVESILRAWHERQISNHLEYLADVRDRTEGSLKRLAAVLQAYALISHESRGHRDTELAALLHGDEHVVLAEKNLREVILDLLDEAVKTGDIRNDVSTVELTSYCLHALTAAHGMPSKAAAQRLAEVTLAGLRP
jgi:AcrR family transcriptional regulator